MRCGPGPDLFGLIAATSNCGDAAGACAATHDDVTAPVMTMVPSDATNTIAFRMMLLDVRLLTLAGCSLLFKVHLLSRCLHRGLARSHYKQIYALWSAEPPSIFPNRGV
jgi:hypothetical protein